MESSEIKIDETEKKINKEGEGEEIIVKEIVEGPSEEDEEGREEKKKSANHFFEIQLGDVIKIYNPKNEVLDNNTFLINYIDESKVELINIDNFDPVTLTINGDNILGDGYITKIELLVRREFPGYAKQNGLVTGKWINIYFGGDVPTIITGEITNLEEDMIEIRTFPDDDIIYINFDYKGIPQDLPIESIEIRDRPERKRVSEEVEEGEIAVAEEEVLEEKEKLSDLEEGEIPDIVKKPTVKERIELSVPINDVRTQIREFIINADQIKFGNEYLGPIVQLVDTSEQRQRYSIESQTTDLLDELLSTIPNIQRTPKVLNNIHTMIERFKQLRESFSEFDEYGNAKNAVVYEANFKPLLSYFKNFNKNLLWILPVVKNVKKMYNILNVSPLGTQTYDSESTDSIELNMFGDLNAMDAIIRSYKGNELTDENDKYTSLYTNLNPYFTPFEYINAEDTDGIIYVKEVNENITTIINNLDQFYSTVMANNNTVTRRFVIQKYNMGLTKLTASNFSGPKMLAKVVNMTNPDIMDINSFITLPEPVIRYSRINLPGTNILDRANLNNVYFNFWQLMKSKSPINDIFVDNINEDIEYNENNFANNIKNYILNLDVEDENLVNKVDKTQIYIDFIKTIIPKTRILFKLMKKYITGKLSVVEVVGFLEPFLVYSDNITYMLYKDITRFIDEKISEYNKKFSSGLKNFLELKKIPSNKNYSLFKESILNLLEKKNNLKENVFNSYGIDIEYEARFFTNSETLQKITVKDCGKLYTTAITLENIPLMFPKEINDILESEKELNKTKIENESDKENDCKKVVVAKLYRNEEELMRDNDSGDIYFDKIYDKTNYSILDDYEKDMNKMTPEEFINFLPNALEKKYKLSPSDAEYLSDTLISGIKRVIDGQYGIINIKAQGTDDKLSSTIEYYKRVNNRWEKDESTNIETTDSDIFCNLQEKCISDTKSYSNDCESMKLNELELKDELLKDIISEFDQKYYKSKEEFTQIITEKYEYNLSILPILMFINNEFMLKTNNKKYKLGIFEEDSQTTPTIVSPFSKLLSLITSQSDFVKKQIDTVRFVNEFTRQPYDGVGPLGKVELPYWFYCIKTDVPLIPMFRYNMALCFLNTPDQYLEYIQVLIKELGKLNDEGDSWVDKYSGQTIVKIDFSTDEGFEDGFRVSSREIIEAGAGDKMIMVGNTNKQQIVMTGEIRMIINIVNVLSVSMGINMEDQKEFIINSVTEMIKMNVPEESAYKKSIKAANDAGKTVPTYKELYNGSILFYTFGAYLVAVQTSVPSIKTRKTFPGCVRSFVGYPFDGTGDLSSLNYLSCIAYKLRGGDEPWSALKRTKEEIISKKIKAALDGTEKTMGLLKLADVARKMDEKTAYLIENPDNDIPLEHDVMNWTNFLPPLVPIKIKHLVNVSPEFKSGLLKDLKDGSINQRDKILVVESKIIQFSLAIQEKIGGVVQKKQAILHKANNEPFLENACCDEKGKMTTIQYFETEDGSITEFNAIVKGLSNILDDIDNYTEAQLLYSIVDTKNIYPPLNQNFNDKTIYLTFIKYCNFRNLMPIKEEFLPLCLEKPDYIRDNDSIEEIIRKLKEDKKDYSNETFLRLVQLVGRNNIIDIDVDKDKLPNSIGNLTSTLEAIDNENDEVVEPALRGLLTSVLNKFSVEERNINKESEKLNNYLIKNIDNMKEEILEFIEQNKDRSVTRRIQSRAAKLINTLSNWETDTSKLDNKHFISNGSLYNVINFFKLFIGNLASIFPTIILNKVDYNNINLPVYWGLSMKHANDIHRAISEYYEGLREFYNDVELYNILRKIQSSCKNLVLLANATPGFTEIKYGERILKPIFEERTCKYLFEYYLLRVFIEFIELSDHEDMIVTEMTRQLDVQDIFSSEYLDERETRNDINIGNRGERETMLVSGNKKKLKQKICNLLIAFTKIIDNHKDNVDISYDNIKDFIFKLKEREKNTFTDRLKGMTDEERNVDNVLKITKQGVWSKGLEKGLTTYDADNYDQERDFMEMMANVDKTLRKNKKYNGEKGNLDMDDFIEDAENAAAIEQDAYDMTNMREDYMDGDDLYTTLQGEEIDWGEYD
jgi:hypothetical protein